MVIVSTDRDLYQLLRQDRVSVWDPLKKKPVTERSFTMKYGIGPDEWAPVKAIAGCPGVKGVGEKTAIKYLTAEMNMNTKTYVKIMKAGDLIARNLKLVELPFAGVRRFVLSRTDEVTKEKWRAVLERLGIKGRARRGLLS